MMNNLAPVQPNPAVVVIGPQFCMGYPVDLTIVREMMSLNFRVRDVDGNIMFKVKRKCFSLQGRRVLLDAAGNPIITLQEKLMSMHRRWQVFRGESRDARDMLFSIRKSSLLQIRTEVDVFLASNTREKVCDFKIRGSWFGSSCVIYAGNSNNIIAQMHRNNGVQSILLGKDSFGVAVYPNVDYAFVVALVVLLEEIRKKRRRKLRTK